jgi:hypothetical protein
MSGFEEEVMRSGLGCFAGLVGEEATMKPEIQETVFGKITIDNEVYQHDIVIRLGGEVKKRKKKLSKKKHGTSHTVSLDEAEHIFEEGAKRLIVGTSQYDNLRLSEEAEEYFRNQGCSVDLLPTPDALRAWNESEGETIGMFHVTC